MADTLALGIINRIKASPEAMEAINGLVDERLDACLETLVFPRIKTFIENTAAAYLIENGFAKKV